MKLFFAFIIYWSITITVLTVVSPLLIFALMLQPFVETGVIKLFREVFQHWADMVQDVNDPVGALERKKIADAKKAAALPPPKPKDFFDSLDYMTRKTYMDIGQDVSYHPDKDSERSDLITPFRPNFAMVADAELLEKLKHKWLCKAQELMLVDTFTKSKWDSDGYTRINDIFFTPYSVHGSPELQVTNEKEHQWLKECWSIAYDKLEYIKILMNRAYENNKNLNKNPEFIFRYKIVSNQLASLNHRFNISVDKVRSMAGALVGKRIAAFDPVQFFFDFREATLQNNMYTFFKNANNGKN
jgi:hypothetical protein